MDGTRRKGAQAVAIAAIIKKPQEPDRIILVKQFRPPAGKYAIEFPAGLIDAGEDAQTAALRELKEETGYTGIVKHVSPIVYSDLGMSNANSQLVFVEVDATDPRNQNPKAENDDGEFVEVITVPTDQLLKQIQEWCLDGLAVSAKLYCFAVGMVSQTLMGATERKSEFISVLPRTMNSAPFCVLGRAVGNLALTFVSTVVRATQRSDQQVVAKSLRQEVREVQDILFPSPVRHYNLTPGELQEAQTIVELATKPSKMGEFSVECVPLDEALAFYSLDSIPTSLNRPWIWFNYVSSFDGVTTLLEQSPHDISIISLSLSKKGGLADYRMLHCGWSMADAVIFGAETLRNEPHMSPLLAFEDLVEYRLNKLKTTPFPIAVVLTTSGRIDLLGKFFTTKPTKEEHSQRKLVFTTTEGRKRMIAAACENYGLTCESINTLLKEMDVEIMEMPTPSNGSDPNADSYDNSGVCLRSMVDILHKRYNVRFIDIAAGPATIVQFLKLNLIDECRMTKTGIMVGGTNSQGSPRTMALHPLLSENLVDGTLSALPLLSYIGIRLYGDHHLFIRAQLNKR